MLRIFKKLKSLLFRNPDSYYTNFVKGHLFKTYAEVVTSTTSPFLILSRSPRCKNVIRLSDNCWKFEFEDGTVVTVTSELVVMRND